MKNLSVIILAAGKGKRMKSETPKALHEICFKPIIYYILKSVHGLKPENIFVVVGHKSELLLEYLGQNFKDVKTVLQKEQLGTGHAAKTAGIFLKEFSGNCLIIPGDIPLISTKTLQKLFSHKIKNKSHAAILSSVYEDPSGYGRIIKDENGRIVRIVEETDAAVNEKKIKEVNTSVYCFDTTLLFKHLNRLGSDNAQKEYYLTDVIENLANEGYKVTSVSSEDSSETEGINDRSQLSRLEKKMVSYINKKFMLDGVTFRDPGTSYISPDVKIGKDTVIEPFCIIKGGTSIGKDCIIGPFSQIDSCKIGAGTKINKSVLQEAIIGDQNDIGPTSYIRPGTVTGDKVKIGACCEIKNSVIKSGSKVPHLSYIGDARIDEGVNVGAGTITCNYDGFFKNRTIIEGGVFIGSDTMLVAPVKIGKGAITAAGSVISQDVPPDSLAIERSRQENIEEGSKRFREKKQGLKGKIKK